MKLQTEKKLREIRKFFPITRKYKYFANANIFPLNKLALKEILKQIKKKKWGNEYDDYFNNYITKVKSEITSLYEGSPQNILFFRNSTESLFFIINLLKKYNFIKDHDQVLTYSHNFPSLKSVPEYLSTPLNFEFYKIPLSEFTPIGKPITIQILKK